jgi:hypothetical protein
MPHRVFWLEPTELVQVRLRVYRYEKDVSCIAATHAEQCCDADVVIYPQAAHSAWIEDLEGGTHRTRTELVGEDDPRWPSHCDACGVAFSSSSAPSTPQVWAETLYRGAPDGQLYTLRNAPIGAMWHADWLADHAGGAWTGPDGLSITVRTPGGDWCIDGEASNCTRKQSVPVEGKPGWTRFERTHYCWIRHGDPRSSDLHVDKNGNTCEAGAGSILIGKYHGFLHNGMLTDG